MPRTCSLNSKRSAALVFGAPIKPGRMGDELLLCIPIVCSSELRHELLPNADVSPSITDSTNGVNCRLSSSPRFKTQNIRFRFLIDPFGRIDQSVHVPRMHRKQRRSPARARILQSYINHVATCFEILLYSTSHLSVGNKKPLGDLYYLVGGDGS